MTEEDIELLAAPLKKLLDAERERPGFSPAVLAHLRERVDTSCVPAAGDDGDLAAEPTTATAPALWSGRSGAVLASFLAGALVGGAFAAALMTRPRLIVPPASPPPATALPETGKAPAIATPTSGATSASDLKPLPSARVATRTPPSRRERPDSDRDLELAAERAPLETARTALSRGKPQAALDALGEHQRRFPFGRLGEEREALAIEALVQGGRSAEARARAARFRAKFPSSLLLPAVDAAMKQIP
jgi:hypothetical protein